MNIDKKLPVFYLVAIMSFFLLVSTVSASGYTIDLVTVDGVSLEDNVSVVAGETIEVKVWFEAKANDTDVSMEVEIEGEKVETKEATSVFDVEDGKTYRKVIGIKVPYELKDQVSDSATLTVEIDGKNYKEIKEYTINLQRPSYNIDIKSVSVDKNVRAGETIPVDIVIKNRGYNDLDDVYVAVSIPSLDVEKTAYFGDLVAIESCSNSCDDDDDTDTASGRLYIKVPYSAEQGVYALEVEVSNDDTTANKVTQIAIGNSFPENVIVTASSKTASAGEEAEYELLVINPTNELTVFRVISENNQDVSSRVSNSVIAVPAGSSKTITVAAKAEEEGQYSFDVTVLSADSSASVATLNLNVEGRGSVDAVTILTIILAIIFVVLLIVLIVLIGKKSDKAEEFGESYY